MNSHLNLIDVLDALNVLLKCQILLNCSELTFISVKQLYEVDVVEHHRLCDEFSHIVNRSFLASPSL